jgi:hypothetical protein
MNTPPVSISRAILRASSTLRVHILPLNPNWLALAALTAASAFETRIIAATGPNVSSSKTAIPGFTSVMTVGG